MNTGPSIAPCGTPDKTVSYNPSVCSINMRIFLHKWYIVNILLHIFFIKFLIQFYDKLYSDQATEYHLYYLSILSWKWVITSNTADFVFIKLSRNMKKNIRFCVTLDIAARFTEYRFTWINQRNIFIIQDNIYF